jgi:cytidylate kinase
MGNALMIYLNKRLEEEKNSPQKGVSTAGPVITISREVGCNGIKLADLIAKRLNKRKTITEWKVLSKEVFYESAKELHLEPERISRILKQTDKYTFEEILKAFGDRQYKSERKIIKTVSDVVRSFAIDGFSIIVGRAGHIIAKDIKNALHIRLTAPLDYRIKTIMENNKLNHQEAIHFIQRIEKERIAFRKAICEEKVVEENFDICINRASFETDEIVDVIEYIVDKKKMLEGYKQKVDYY